MSAVIDTKDLTLYGCPMHYIKAREFISKRVVGEQALLLVNNGDAVDEVINSLRQDGQLCEIESKKSLTTTIRVTKKI